MNKIKSGDFIKLTGSTLKTINYYHKIGLLAEPERSAAGYRLYGPAELNRMRLIKRLKSLGLDLKQIKEIAGNLPDPKTSREVLESLRAELLSEMNTLEDRLAKIDTLLSGDDLLLEADGFDSPSFHIMTELLGEEQIEKYASACPEIYEQHRKLSGILDDFDWGEEYRESNDQLAEYFKSHPDHYQLALELGARWEELLQVDADDPRIEAFAREAAALAQGMPLIKELYTNPVSQKPPEGLYQEMVAAVLSPAQLKYQELFKQFLQSAD